MKKIINFFKNKPLLTLILVSVIIAVVYSVLTYKKAPPQPGESPLPSGKPSSQIPDISFPDGLRKQDDFNEKFGEPLTEKKDDNNTIATYKSKSPTTPHEVIFDKSGEVVFFKDIVAANEARNALDIRRIYGNPTVLHSVYGPGGLQLLAYPENGIAYVGLEHDKTMLEVWYFKSMSEDALLSTWAKEYSRTPPNQTKYY